VRKRKRWSPGGAKEPNVNAKCLSLRLNPEC
jgi:hypothetical protein